MAARLPLGRRASTRSGRGPLAGPVGVAAVILDPDDLPEGLDDSKALSEAQARRAAAASSSPRRSASRSSSRAPRRSTPTTSAARRCARWRARSARCSLRPDLALIDGRDMPDGLICPARADHRRRRPFDVDRRGLDHRQDDARRADAQPRTRISAIRLRRPRRLCDRRASPGARAGRPLPLSPALLPPRRAKRRQKRAAARKRLRKR